jgi:hypothetical protein
MATAFMPCRSVASLTEGGDPIDESAGAIVMGEVEDRTVLALVSGTYRFMCDI